MNVMISIVFKVGMVLLSATTWQHALVSATKGVAKTPPLGFNTWNHFGCAGINATVLMRTADLMVSTGLHAAGYEYVNMDDCWMLPAQNRSNNGTGPQIPNPEKFPNGLQEVIDHVHSKGLKFGLYTARGHTTCGQFAASCMHEEVDAKQYAEWQVDYLKDDSCGSCRPEGPLADYAAMQQAIDATGRPIVLSIEGVPPVPNCSAGGHGNMRR